MGRGGKVSVPQQQVDPRQRALEQMATKTATSKWLRSQNPLKKRIARLEVAWREGLQWIAEDVQKMFGNFTTIADAYDEIDVNVAAVKSLMVDKGLITEEEFSDRREALIKLIQEERKRRQAELEKLEEQARLQEEDPEEAERVAEAEKKARDGSRVDPELVKMRQKAEKAKDYRPPEAFTFGGE